MIYLDHHATTPVDPRVLSAMLPYFSESFGNAASRQYRYGWEALEAVDRARAQVAALIDADAKDLVWTSGATEANNLALKGLIEVCAPSRPHIVTLATEHKSVLDTCRRLARSGVEVTVLPVQQDGHVDLETLQRAVTPRTAVVSVMAANNEIGVVAPLAEIAAIAHAHGALVHSDAAQAAHKLYGPKGVGALYVRRKPRRVALAPQMDGGGHERGLRSGTLNVPGIVGFGAAAEIARAELPSEARRLEGLRARLLDGLRRAVPGVIVNGSLDRRLPGNLNVSIPGVDGEALLVSLCDELAVSSGAACTAAEPSHVLTALGRKTDLALASLRFGLGRATSAEEIDRAVGMVGTVVQHLRAMAPV
jgi:cysteine desulfurase